MHPLVETQRITKHYGNHTVLNQLSLTFEPNTIHAVTGENGAGKSTLMKILAGIVYPDEGKIFVSGQPVKIDSPSHALALGISTVFQEFTLIPNLSVAENLFLGHEPTTWLGNISQKAIIEQTEEIFTDIGLQIDPRLLVSELSIAQQQFVEITKGIKTNADVFILDEPTAALNTSDVDLLSQQILKLKSAGKAIVYVSHRLEEIFEFCTVVTVLKDGNHIETLPTQDLTPQKLTSLMVGRDICNFFPKRAQTLGEVVLSVKNIMISEKSSPISFEIRQGEILGLAGLEGQGQRELARSLVGFHNAAGGEIAGLNHQVKLPLFDKGLSQMLKKGIGFVPEDRKIEGLFLGLSVQQNMVIGMEVLKSNLAYSQNFREKIKSMMKLMSIKANHPNVEVRSLSGGNQQKTLLARWLLTEVNILIIEEPTRGVDVGAKIEIYHLLREFTKKGGAILVVSQEMTELIGLCDRLIVIHEQKYVLETMAEKATEHDLLNASLIT